jgi:hypothetical protein
MSHAQFFPLDINKELERAFFGTHSLVGMLGRLNELTGIKED